MTTARRKGTPAGDGISVAQASPFAEVGTPGLRQYSGFIREEFLRTLQGREGAKAYREMIDNDATVGAVLFAIKQTMRKVDWRVDPPDDTTAAADAAEFVDSLRDDMECTWQDFLLEALSMLGFGYAPMEKVYKRRSGRTGDPTTTSKFDDGMIGLRKISLRGQDTILRWLIDQNTNELLGLTQQPWTGTMVDIPIAKLVIFRPESYKENPEGRSVLRTAYRAYYMKKRIEDIEAIGIERDLAGLPVARIPASIMKAASGTGELAAQAMAIVNSYKTMVQNVRRDEQEGLVLPSDKDEKGNYAYDVSLLTSGGSRQMDTDKTISRYEQQIAMSVMADFILVGHGSRGTQALALSKTDMFLAGVQGWLDSIAETFNRYVLPEIWELNGLDFALMPTLEPDLTRRVDLAELGTFIQNLSASGMPLFPDLPLENNLREAAGLPPSTDTAESRAQQMQDQEDDGDGPEDSGSSAKPVDASPAKGGAPGGS